MQGRIHGQALFSRLKTQHLPYFQVVSDICGSLLFGEVELLINLPKEPIVA
jgi:hypothetical protein